MPFVRRATQFVLVSLLLLAAGCAAAPPAGTEPAATVLAAGAESSPQPAVHSPAPETKVEPGPIAKTGAVVTAPVEPVRPSFTDVASFERTDLKSVSKVRIHLVHADVLLASGSEHRRGSVRIDKVAGDPDCKVRVRLGPDAGAGDLEIIEAPRGGAPQAAKMSAVSKVKSSVPVVDRCRFLVTVNLREAVEASVELVRGSLTVEQWDEPLSVKLEWGDVDVGSVGKLAVSCGHCMLSGEGVSGPLSYALESGNVGFAGLTGSVDGHTAGDTVLKWRRLKADSAVRIVSHAGDVMLFFPDGTPLSIDLKAPHGDVNSRLESGSRGVPVTVTAELGNVQVYRAGAKGAH